MKKYKKPLLLLLLSFSTILVLTFLLRKKNNQIEDIYQIHLRKIDSFLIPEKICKIEDSYKICISNDNLFLLTSNECYQVLEKNKFRLISHNKNICAIYQSNDTLITFDDNKGQLNYYKNNIVFESKNIENADFNILISNSNVLYAKNISTTSKNYCLYDINNNLILDVSKIINPILKGIEPFCKDYYSEGASLLIRDSIIIYYPYRTNFLISKNLNTNKIKLYKTIDTTSFIKMKKIEVSIGSNKTMINCSPENGQEFINSCITNNNNFLMLLPNLVIENYNNKMPVQYIDFYSLDTFKYLFTKKIKFDNQDEYILDIKSDNQNLYFLTSNGILYKSSL